MTSTHKLPEGFVELTDGTILDPFGAVANPMDLEYCEWLDSLNLSADSLTMPDDPETGEFDGWMPPGV